MTMKKTLYISDLDGTLLNENAALSEYAKKTLNNLISRGLHFTVASGRTTDAAAKLIEDLNVSIPIIAFTGVDVFDVSSNRHIHVHWLSGETARSVVQLLRRHQVTPLIYQLNGNNLVSYYETLAHEPIRAFVENRISRFQSEFCQIGDFDNLTPDSTIYFFLTDRYDKLSPVYSTLHKMQGVAISFMKDSYSDDLWMMEVFSDNASKENAVRFLRETYNFERVIGFGDNLNDLPLFAACDIKIAVENASHELKAVADYVCDTNNNDGVVKWLEENYRG